MKREQTKSMRELLPLLIQEMGWEPGLNEARVSALWDELLGPSVATATYRKQLKEGKFYVKLNSSVVRSYILTEKKNIMIKINEAMGKRVVTELILY